MGQNKVKFVLPWLSKMKLATGSAQLLLSHRSHHKKKASFRVNVEIKAPEGGLTNNSLILLNQIRVIDRSRLGRYWGHVSPETMQKVNEAIKISLGACRALDHR